MDPLPLIDPLLAEILVCPRCRGPLEENEDRSVLICTDDGLEFPVEDGVPNMLLDD